MELLDSVAAGSPRSYLYVPGDRQDRLDGALSRGADALILDLEDSVAIDQKALARERVSHWLESADTRAQLWVRINAGALEADIAAAVTAATTGIMVPKAEPAVIDIVDELLSARESELGLPPGQIAVIPLIESARGLLRAVELGEARRTVRLAIGRADLAAELRLRMDAEDPDFRPLLLQLVVASAAAGIAPPVAPTSTDFRDLVALRESTETLMRLGFLGRTAVHPGQLAVINEVFTPSAAEVATAERLVAAFEEAESAGSGVTVDENGRMVDIAVVRSARELLRRAGTIRAE